MTPEDLAALIRSGVRRPDGMRTAIVAIDGFGGAGKSTLAAGLAPLLEAEIVRTDDFSSWDVPIDWWPRLREQVLVPLSANEPARYQRWDWDLRALAEWHEITPAPHLIVEGVGSTQDDLRSHLAFTIWVDTPADERLRRGRERDGEGARGQWEEWTRAELEWAARQRPRERADVVVPGD